MTLLDWEGESFFRRITCILVFPHGCIMHMSTEWCGNWTTERSWYHLKLFVAGRDLVANGLLQFASIFLINVELLLPLAYLVPNHVRHMDRNLTKLSECTALLTTGDLDRNVIGASGSILPAFLGTCVLQGISVMHTHHYFCWGKDQSNLWKNQLWGTLGVNVYFLAPSVEKYSSCWERPGEKLITGSQKSSFFIYKTE